MDSTVPSPGVDPGSVRDRSRIGTTPERQMSHASRSPVPGAPSKRGAPADPSGATGAARRLATFGALAYTI
jgi:hypothetical protein